MRSEVHSSRARRRWKKWRRRRASFSSRRDIWISWLIPLSGAKKTIYHPQPKQIFRRNCKREDWVWRWSRKGTWSQSDNLGENLNPRMKLGFRIGYRVLISKYRTTNREKRTALIQVHIYFFILFYFIFYYIISMLCRLDAQARRFENEIKICGSNKMPYY